MMVSLVMKFFESISFGITSKIFYAISQFDIENKKKNINVSLYDILSSMVESIFDVKHGIITRGSKSTTQTLYNVINGTAWNEFYTPIAVRWADSLWFSSDVQVIQYRKILNLEKIYLNLTDIGFIEFRYRTTIYKYITANTKFSENIKKLLVLAGIQYIANKGIDNNIGIVDTLMSNFVNEVNNAKITTVDFNDSRIYNIFIDTLQKSKIDFEKLGISKEMFGKGIVGLRLATNVVFSSKLVYERNINYIENTKLTIWKAYEKIMEIMPVTLSYEGISEYGINTLAPEFRSNRQTPLSGGNQRISLRRKKNIRNSKKKKNIKRYKSIKNIQEKCVTHKNISKLLC
jgi:hypothetical protein